MSIETQQTNLLKKRGGSVEKERKYKRKRKQTPSTNKHLGILFLSRDTSNEVSTYKHFVRTKEYSKGVRLFRMPLLGLGNSTILAN